MTPDRQCKAKPTDRSGLYCMVIYLVLNALGQSIEIGMIRGDLKDLSETLAATAPTTPGRQQGVSTPECPPVEGQSVESQGEQLQQVSYHHGRLAQSVEQRTFNPQSTSTQYQPESKLGGFSRDSGATSAPGCARLHVGRVSGGCQEDNQ